MSFDRSALGSRIFRPPLVDPTIPVRETPSASFGDLVRMMAEGIADAQASLDRASAELVAELANTPIEIVPSVTETIDAQGNVTYETAPPRTVSLLDIGVLPTFYQFSEATIEVVMDLHIVESEAESGQTEQKKKHWWLRADTASVRFERKLNRDVKTSSKLTAKLVPVPMPLRLEPARNTLTTEDGNG
jgi:hypothetical protein